MNVLCGQKKNTLKKSLLNCSPLALFLFCIKNYTVMKNSSITEFVWRNWYNRICPLRTCWPWGSRLQLREASFNFVYNSPTRKQKIKLLSSIFHLVVAVHFMFSKSLTEHILMGCRDLQRCEIAFLPIPTMEKLWYFKK